jgi:hypothetical protein
MKDDAKMAAIARELADALRDAAYSRKDEDRKRVHVLHTCLCAAARAEEQIREVDGNTPLLAT